jgi:hypothetical protein
MAKANSVLKLIESWAYLLFETLQRDPKAFFGTYIGELLVSQNITPEDYQIMKAEYTDKMDKIPCN